MIGKLQRVPLRDVWKHEAYDFTTWLEKNYEVLNEVLGLRLSGIKREQAAGNLSVDLVGEDGDGQPVVIENQLGKSDHDHLGKLLTYLSELEAKRAVWIVSEARAEHVRAVSWLNSSSSAEFYLVKAEAFKIGDSEPAPLLTLIIGPSEEGKRVAAQKQEMAERYDIRFQFWDALLKKASEKSRLHANISPGRYSWVGAGSGKRGLGFNYVVWEHETAAELYVDRGKESDDENMKIFQTLEGAKKEIEEVFGGPLEWQPLEERRACRIRKSLAGGGYRDPDKWPQVTEALAQAMTNLEKALKPHIAKLEI